MIKVKAYFEKRNQYDNEFTEFIFKDIKDLKKWGKQDFDRKVFTINCVAKNKEEENFYGVSARLDMTNRVIKTIVPGKEVFYEYPIRTLQAFELMSLTGFKIDKEVLKNIKSTMRFLRFMPSEQVGNVLRKIIVGKYASETFKTIFECVQYKLILGLTATFERLDGKHELIKKYCPICDTITLI